MSNRLDHRLLVWAQIISCPPLQLPGDHVVNDLVHRSSPLVGQDVRELVDDDDIAPLHEHVLSKLELGFQELGADLRVALGSPEFGLVRRTYGPSAETHPPYPNGEPLLEPLRRLELALPGRSILRLDLWCVHGNSCRVHGY